MRFTKMHGAGNDFVIVDGLGGECDLQRIAAAAPAVCDRHTGVGSDGLILVLKGDRAHFRMRMWNPDGSEAEMCGNGIRCFTRYLERSSLLAGGRATVETTAGLKTVEVISSDEHGSQVRVDMGVPGLRREDIPMRGTDDGSPVIHETLVAGGHEFNVTCVSMGVPHCVVRVEDVEAFPVTEYGPRIEHHDIFPRRTNVPFVEVLSDSELRVRVWERGAGLTLACGTGACASVVAGSLNGWTGRSVLVHLDGGDLQIDWPSDDSVLMTGPAVEVFTGEYPL